jgi:cellulose synthase/poly-beta-1,6-N-acetylglucosamine synthase-like glycosyltransferase
VDRHPAVSVVVPARNEASSIGRCLRGLRAQDYPPELVEILVVDDGSGDETARVAESCGVGVLRGPRRGVARARNEGIRRTRGEIVAFTDADCVPHPAWLRELTAGFDDPRVGVVAGDVLGLRLDTPVARFVEEGRFMRADALAATPGGPVAITANVAYRRRVFDLVGLFDERLRSATDMEMTWRVMRDGRFLVAWRPSAVVFHDHPRTLAEMLRQAHRWGAGGAAVHRKYGHRASLLYELEHKAWMVAAGCAVAPARALWRMTGGRRRARGAGSPLFPFLQAARTAAFAAGWIQGVLRPEGDGGWDG